MKKVNYKAGQKIFKQGETANQLFIISSGKVGLYFPTNELMEEPNIVLNSPEIFGEMISVSKGEFEKKLENSDVVIRGIIAILSERLRELQKRR